MYAAAAAAANNSAPPSSTTFGEVSTLGDAATPGASAADATRSDASPRDDAGAPALTPASERDTPYDVRPQRDVAGALRFDPRVVSSPAAISAVAAKIAAAAVADAAPGESPRRPRGASRPEWRRRWIQRISRRGRPRCGTAGTTTRIRRGRARSARSTTSGRRACASPRRGWGGSRRRRDGSRRRRGTRGVASADDDDDFAAAEAEARALADAEKVTPPETPARVLDGVAVPTRAASFAPPMRVFAEDDAASIGTASLAFDASLSLDGRSLAALANALDARSFDARSESEAEDDDAFGSETRDAEAPAPAKSETKRRGAKTGKSVARAGRGDEDEGAEGAAVDGKPPGKTVRGVRPRRTGSRGGGGAERRGRGRGGEGRGGGDGETQGGGGGASKEGGGV